MTNISRSLQTILVLALVAGMGWMFNRFVIIQVALFGAVAVMLVRDIWKGRINFFSSKTSPPPVQTEGRVMGYDLDCE